MSCTNNVGSGYQYLTVVPLSERNRVNIGECVAACIAWNANPATNARPCVYGYMQGECALYTGANYDNGFGVAVGDPYEYPNFIIARDAAVSARACSSTDLYTTTTSTITSSFTSTTTTSTSTTTTSTTSTTSTTTTSTTTTSTTSSAPAPTCSTAEEAVCPLGSTSEVQRSTDNQAYLISCTNNVGSGYQYLTSSTLPSQGLIGACIAVCVAWNADPANAGRSCVYGYILGGDTYGNCALYTNVNYDSGFGGVAVGDPWEYPNFIIARDAATSAQACDPFAIVTTTTSTTTSSSSSSTAALATPTCSGSVPRAEEVICDGTFDGTQVRQAADGLYYAMSCDERVGSGQTYTTYQAIDTNMGEDIGTCVARLVYWNAKYQGTNQIVSFGRLNSDGNGLTICQLYAGPIYNNGIDSGTSDGTFYFTSSFIVTYNAAAIAAAYVCDTGMWIA